MNHSRPALAGVALAAALAAGCATAPPGPDPATIAALARLALAQVEMAAALGPLAEEPAPPPPREPDVSAEERSRLKARLAKSQEEQKKLEEKVSLLQRDLDTTETEVIRTKAKLKGIETKAEASSAIAEARILILRTIDEKKGDSAVIARSREKLDIAERQLREANFGAALFFALQAQDLLADARRTNANGRKK